MELLEIILLLFVVVVIGIGVYIYNSNYQTQKVVELMRPRDSRGKELVVAEETDIGIRCKGKEGATHLFIKAGRAWTFDGRPTKVKFFGVEGSAYTALIQDAQQVQVSIAEFLKLMWGDRFYNAIPQAQRTLIETAISGITVEPQRINLSETGLRNLSPDDIDRVSDDVILGKIAKGQVKGEGIDYKLMGVIYVLGALSMYFLVMKGLV